VYYNLQNVSPSCERQIHCCKILKCTNKDAKLQIASVKFQICKMQMQRLEFVKCKCKVLKNECECVCLYTIVNISRVCR